MREEGVLPEGGGANELLVELICVVVVRETVGEVLNATPAWETSRVAMFQSLVWTSVERVLDVGPRTRRWSLTARGQVIVILNLTPAPRDGYRIGVPLPGVWKTVFNSDKEEFGGSNYPVSGATMTEEINWQGKAFSIAINLPPLSALILKA